MLNGAHRRLVFFLYRKVWYFAKILFALGGHGSVNPLQIRPRMQYLLPLNLAFRNHRLLLYKFHEHQKQNRLVCGNFIQPQSVKLKMHET